MPLSALPDTFGINDTQKGWFPFLFNLSENQNYIGKWPDAWFYNVGSMKPEAKKEFYKWYNEQSHKVSCIGFYITFFYESSSFRYLISQANF